MTKNTSEQQFMDDEQRITAMEASGDQDGLVRISNEIRHRPCHRDPERFARLMLQIADILATHGDAYASNAHECIKSALGKAESLPIDLHVSLVRRINDTSFRATKDASASARRADNARAWLSAWRRLNEAVASEPPAVELPMLNVAPPLETGLPSGIAPSAIDDPGLRAIYEADIAENNRKSAAANRRLMVGRLKATFPSRAERYLVELYSGARHDVEITSLLDEYGIEDDGKKRILTSITSSDRGR